MKKLFVLGLIMFVLPLFVYASEQSTTLSYTVSEDATYEWSVPASVTVTGGVSTNNMQGKPAHSATITITASNVVLPSGYQLVIYYPEAARALVNGTSSIPYYINEGEGDAAWNGQMAEIMSTNRLALRVLGNETLKTQDLTITVYESDIAAATALGEHTDVITFSSAVILNEE